MVKSILTKKEPEKRLLARITRTGGRGNLGRITVRHRGGGARKLYRKVTFGQVQLGQKGRVSSFEYDPGRNAWIMLVEYQDGSKYYMLAPHGIQVGDEIVCDEKADVRPGNRMRLKNIPSGEQVHNIELIPGRGGVLVRAAGNSAKVNAHEGKYAQLVFPSSEIRKVLGESFASIGIVSNPEFLAEGKAVYDFTHPDKIVVGAHSPAAFSMMRKVYTGRVRTYIPVVETDWETAEMIKYANNSFLATKISFMNEIANICDKVGADVRIVAQAMGMDYRINPRFLNPGIG
ncbi:MAG: 50S ribosomal protein L2, partial [Parcubacteria group bacterium GW2011_GWA2_50_10]